MFNKIITRVLPVFAFALLLGVATPAFAAVFNNDSRDFPTLMAVNYSDNGQTNTRYSTSVNADAGEIITFHIYYHNTATDSAQNTRVSLNVPQNQSGTNFTASASVFADNAGAVTGSTQVNLSSTQSLSFVSGSVVWHPDNCAGCTRTLPLGQNGSELLTSQGLNLGSIGPDSFAGSFSSQGSVVANFQVTGNNNGNNNNNNNGTNLPGVTTNSPTSVTGTSASLNGFLNANGNSQTTGYFEYSTNSSFSPLNTTSSQTFTSSTVSYGQTISGLVPNTTYFYRAIAFGNNGQRVTGNTQSFVTSNDSNCFPAVSTNAATQTGNNTTAILNGFLSSTCQSNGNTSVFFEYGTTGSLGSRTGSQTLSSGSFSVPVSGLLSNTTYFFRAVAQNSGGTNQGGILSFTTNGTFTSISNNVQVITNSASNVDTTLAVVNGFASANGTNLQSSWFEYGTDTNLNQSLPEVALNSVSSQSFSRTIFNLNPNTTYFYRAVARANTGEVVRGGILSFVTRPATVVAAAPVSTVATAVVRQPDIRSLFLVSYGTDKDFALPGDLINYKIGWRNETGLSLPNAVMRISLPAGVAFAGSDSAISASGNMLFYSIGRIPVGGSGSIQFRATTDQSVGAEPIVLNTTVTFTDPNTLRPVSVSVAGILPTTTGAGNVTDGGVVGVNSGTDSTRVASLATALGSFFPSSASGWLGLVALLIIVVALSKTLL